MKLMRLLSLLALVLLIGSSLSVSLLFFEQKSDINLEKEEILLNRYGTSKSELRNSWEYRKKLKISSPIKNYQMRLNVSYSGGGDISCEGHCNEDFSDIRFTSADGKSIRPYWIEKK